MLGYSYEWCLSRHCGVKFNTENGDKAHKTGFRNCYNFMCFLYERKTRCLTPREDGENCLIRNFLMYSSLNIIRVIKLITRWTGHTTAYGRRNAYKTLILRSERNRPLGRTRCQGVDWIRMVQVRDQWRTLLNKIMKFQFQKKVGNFWKHLHIISNMYIRISVLFTDANNTETSNQWYTELCHVKQLHSLTLWYQPVFIK
jgi:hypothetical protein